MLTRKKKLEFLLPLVVLGAWTYIILAAKTAAFPFILSMALAYILSPVMSFFETKGLKRSFVVSALYGLVALVAALVISQIVNQIGDEFELLQKQWPIYHNKVTAMFASLEKKYINNSPYLQQLYADWSKTAGLKAGELAAQMPSFILSLLPALSLLVLVPFITFFFLWEGPDMLDRLLDYLPSRYVETFMYVFSEVDESLGNYIRGLFAESCIIFSVALVGLTVMNLEYAIAIAVAMGVSCLIPYLGPAVVALVAAGAAFVQYGEIGAVVEILIFFACLRFMDDWLLQPFIMKKAVEIHPAMIVFALLVGAEMFGFWGILFAMPTACILKVLFTIAYELHSTIFGWRPKPAATRVSIPYT